MRETPRDKPDWRGILSENATLRRRAEAAEAKVSRVQEILDVDGQWYSGPLLARKVAEALVGPESRADHPDYDEAWRP